MLEPSALILEASGCIVADGQRLQIWWRLSPDGSVLRSFSAGFQQWVGTRWSSIDAEATDARTIRLGGRTFALARIEEDDGLRFVAIEERNDDALVQLGTLIRGLVHDSNNALSVVVAATWLVELEDVSEEARQDLVAMRTAALRAAAIGRDIADLAAAPSGGDLARIADEGADAPAGRPERACEELCH